jgi:DNA mismatch endonuclease, patch repair protein
MPDRISPETRSFIMSQIKGKDTAIELLVFKYLTREGIYFQKHYKGVLGNPDIALPRKKKAVFIDGEFWHGKYYAKRKKNLPGYWVAKIKRNMDRDKKYNTELKKLGWNILRVWEDDIIKNPEKYLTKIKIFLLG